MAKRIVKRTLANGKIEYAVESNRLFGFIPVDWHVVTMRYLADDGIDIVCDAVFDNYEEACLYAGFPIESREVVKGEVIKNE